MHRYPLEQYVVYIHWDDLHTSPPIGPFNGITEARKWMTAWRKKAREGRWPRRFKRLSVSILHTPDRGMSWSIG